MNDNDRLILFNNALIAFRNSLRLSALNILNCEMGLKVGRSRFTFNGLSYPIIINVFEHKNRLGYFDPEFYEIGIHKSLIGDNTLTLNVLRHELCHYLVNIEYGPDTADHGVEFQKMCSTFGYNTEVSAAVYRDFNQDVEAPKLLRRIEKLLSLGKSCNIHESQAAIAKANALLSEHDLNYSPEGDTTCLKRSLNKKRHTTKLDVIARLLKAFRVETVINHGRVSVYLEIVGTRSDVAYADYLAHFFDREFERLYQRARLSNTKLSGMRSKNAFFRGLYDGYMSKLPNQRGLIRSTRERLPVIYPHLRRGKSSTQGCVHGKEAGEAAGKGMGIRSPVSLDQKKGLLSNKS